jgi:hypothetical protein
LAVRDVEETGASIQLSAPFADLVACLRCNDRAIEAPVNLETCERVAAEHAFT